MLQADWNCDGTEDHTMIMKNNANDDGYPICHSTDTVSRPLTDLLGAKLDAWRHARNV